MKDKIIVENIEEENEDFVADKVIERKKDKDVVNIIQKIKNQTLDQTNILGYLGFGISLLIITVMLFIYPSSFAFFGRAYGRAFLTMLPYLLIAGAGFVCSILCNKRKEKLLFKLGVILSICAVSICIFIPIWCLIISL